VLSAGDPVREAILSHRALAAMAGAVVLVLIGLATGIVRTAVRDWGFRLDRTEVGLRRRRGLTTITDVTLPARRVQAAIVASGPIRQALGYSELKLQNLGHDEGSGDHVVAPLATAEERDAILAALGWRELPKSARWTRVSAAYVWSRIIALGPLYPIILVQAVAIRFAWGAVPGSVRAIVLRELAPLVVTFVVTLTVALVAIGSRWLAWRTTAYALDGDRLLIRTGWWKRRTAILPLSKIQTIDVKESFVSRWFGTASLDFGVAGGGLVGRHSIPAIPSARARQLRDQLLGLAA
jgi:putative membrane protein